jgi:hypothetical protein
MHMRDRATGPARDPPIEEGWKIVETTDVADQGLPTLFSIDRVAPLSDDAPRCRRCAAVLVVAHLRCDDGGLVPVFRCPICRHDPVASVASDMAPVSPGDTLGLAD